MKRLFNVRKFPSPEERLRILAEKGPQAEAFAASWIERSRPLWTSVHASRRRIATITIAIVTALFFGHVMFGANGMVVYKQKHNELQALQKKITQVQEENQRITQHVEALQHDQKAIEKEAREQLGYAKPGEYVYVAPTPARPQPPANHSARK